MAETQIEIGGSYILVKETKIEHGLEHVYIPDKTGLVKLGNLIAELQRGELEIDDYLIQSTTSYYVISIEENNVITEFKIDKFSLLKTLKQDPCVNKQLISFIITPNNILYLGTNAPNKSPGLCVRIGLTKADSRYDYGNDLCTLECVCNQPVHSETGAVINLLMAENLLSKDDLEYVFHKTSNGLASYLIVDNLIELIESRKLDLSRATIYMHGHISCCNNCAEVLKALNISCVYVNEKSHDNNLVRRDEIHSSINGLYKIVLSEHRSLIEKIFKAIKDQEKRGIVFFKDIEVMAQLGVLLSKLYDKNKNEVNIELENLTKTKSLKSKKLKVEKSKFNEVYFIIEQIGIFLKEMEQKIINLNNHES